MVYQISAFLENRAGQFAEITKILAENSIDLRAISIAETADYGILRMIVGNAEKTTSILMQHGYLMSMTPVLVIAVPDQPGGLAKVLSLLEGNSVDIEYMYALITSESGKAYSVMRTGNTEETDKILTENGIELLVESKLN